MESKQSRSASNGQQADWKRSTGGIDIGGHVNYAVVRENLHKATIHQNPQMDGTADRTKRLSVAGAGKLMGDIVVNHLVPADRQDDLAYIARLEQSIQFASFTDRSGHDVQVVSHRLRRPGVRAGAEQRD